MGLPVEVCSSKTVSEIWDRFSASLRKTPDSEFKPTEEDLSKFQAAYSSLPPRILTLSEITDDRIRTPFLHLTELISSDNGFPDPMLLAIGEARLTLDQKELLRLASNSFNGFNKIEGLRGLPSEFNRNVELHFLNASVCFSDRKMNAAYHYRNGFNGLDEFSTMTLQALLNSEATLLPVDLLRLRQSISA